MKSKKKWMVHLVVWSVWIALEVLILEFVLFDKATFGNYFVHYALVVALFYFHAYILLPKALSNSTSAFKLPAYLIFEFILFSVFSYFIPYYAVKYFGLELKHGLVFNWIFIGNKLIRFFYFAVFSTGYYFFLRYKMAQEEKVALLQQQLETERKHTELEKSILQMEKSLLQMENSMLKAQIDPHFLHSTLDFVYKQAWKTAPIAAEAAAILSRIMRFSSDSCDEAGQVELGVEITHIQNLIDLYQLDSERGCHIQLLVEKDVLRLKIIPLILLTKVENMFKHAYLQDPKHPGLIRIGIRHGGLYIETRNLVGQEITGSSRGTGLINIRKRIRYAYPNNTEFTYGLDETGRFHETKLWVPLLNDGNMPSPLTSSVKNDRSSARESVDPMKTAY